MFGASCSVAVRRSAGCCCGLRPGRSRSCADAISYAASVISKLLIKADFQDVRIDTDPKSAREGLRWVWERPFFRCARCCSRAATRCSPACTC